MKRQRKWIADIAVAVGGLVVLGLGPRMAFRKEQLAPGVTRKAIASIRLGMTEARVRQIMGSPISREQDTSTPAQTTLAYSKPVMFASWYPMVWVALEKGKVTSVGVKRYDWRGGDDWVYMRFCGRVSNGPIQELSGDITDMEGTIPR